MEDLDRDVLAYFERDVLSPRIIERTIRRALELRAERPDEAAARRQALEHERQRLQAELRRYADALGTTGPVPEILEAIETRKRRRAEVQAQLEHLDGLNLAMAWGDSDLAKRIEARLSDWNGALLRQAETARQILRKLLVGRLVLTPDEARRTYTLTGQASYGRLMAGIVGAIGMVPPG